MERPRRRYAFIGAIIGAIIWQIINGVFSWYLTKQTIYYQVIYGSVAAIIGFLLWAYLGAMIMLLGAEFTAQQTEWRRNGCPIEGRPPSLWMNEWSKWENLSEP